MRKESYLSGYREALQDLQEFITSRIKANNGARTSKDLLNVWNDTMIYIHENLHHDSDVKSTEYVFPHEDELASIITNIFKSLKEVK